MVGLLQLKFKLEDLFIHLASIWMFLDLDWEQN
jgi:hypothetical protein